jgi:hypothetical protein
MKAAKIKGSIPQLFLTFSLTEHSTFPNIFSPTAHCNLQMMNDNMPQNFTLQQMI